MSPRLAWILFGFAAALTLACGWRGARPPNPHKGPRMIPWRMLMLIFAFATIVLAAYLAQSSLGRA